MKNLAHLKQTILFIFFVFSCVTSFAQQNYLNGYIVSLQGDTIKGQIDYKNWEKNPSNIQFKKENSENAKAYSATEINAFGISTLNRTEKYISAKVLIAHSSEDMETMDTDGIFKDTEETLFLLQIYDGSYKLYTYKDEKIHFYITEGSQINELKYKKYFDKSKNTIMSSDRYKIQLINLLKNCSTIRETTINNTNYNMIDLIKLLKTYDKCMGVNHTQAAVQESAKVVFGGILATDFSTISAVNGKYRDETISSAGNFAVGVSISLKSPRNYGSSSIQIELLYRRYKFESNSVAEYSSQEYRKYHNKLVGNYAKMNLMYRYQLMLNKLKPFINVGVTQGYKLSDIDKGTTERTYFGTVTNYKEPIFTKERKFETGANLGFGINLNKINIELRGEATRGFAQLNDDRSPIKSLYLNLNYLF